MNTPTLTLIGSDTMVVSPSQLELMKTCPRMWWFRYGWHRVRAGAFAARDGGKAFDAAMNIRYTTLGGAAVTPEVEAQMLDAIDAGFRDLDLPLDEYRTAARYKEVVQAYNATYADEPFEVLGVQVPFAVELGSVQVPEGFWRRQSADGIEAARKVLNDTPLRIILRGILDLLIRRREDGLVLVPDTKTANQWNAQRQAEYDNHAQMKAYAWAVPRIRSEALRLGLTEGMTPEQLAALERLPERVHGCMPNVVVIRKPYARESSASRSDARSRDEFHRLVVTYSPERLEEWRRDALAYVEQMLGHVARDHFPQNEKHCAFHYGKQCSYWDVCSVPQAQRQMVLESDLYAPYERSPIAQVAPENILSETP